MLIMTKSSDDNVEPVRIPGSTSLRSWFAYADCFKITGDHEGSVKLAVFYIFLHFSRASFKGLAGIRYHARNNSFSAFFEKSNLEEN